MIRKQKDPPEMSLGSKRKHPSYEIDERRAELDERRIQLIQAAITTSVLLTSSLLLGYVVAKTTSNTSLDGAILLVTAGTYLFSRALVELLLYRLGCQNVFAAVRARRGKEDAKPNRQLIRASHKVKIKNLSLLLKHVPWYIYLMSAGCALTWCFVIFAGWVLGAVPAVIILYISKVTCESFSREGIISKIRFRVENPKTKLVDENLNRDRTFLKPRLTTGTFLIALCALGLVVAGSLENFKIEILVVAGILFLALSFIVSPKLERDKWTFSVVLRCIRALSVKSKSRKGHNVKEKAQSNKFYSEVVNTGQESVRPIATLQTMQNTASALISVGQLLISGLFFVQGLMWNSITDTVTTGDFLLGTLTGILAGVYGLADTLNPRSNDWKHWNVLNALIQLILPLVVLSGVALGGSFEVFNGSLIISSYMAIIILNLNLHVEPRRFKCTERDQQDSIDQNEQEAVDEEEQNPIDHDGQFPGYREQRVLGASFDWRDILGIWSIWTKDYEVAGSEDERNRSGLGYWSLILGLWVIGTLIGVRDEWFPDALVQWNAGDYWGLLGILVTAFVFILAFRQSQLEERERQGDELVLKALAGINQMRIQNQINDVEEDELVKQLIAIDRSSDMGGIGGSYLEFRERVFPRFAPWNILRESDKRGLLLDIETFTNLRQRGREPAVWFVLSFLAFLISLMSVFVRPTNLESEISLLLEFATEIVSMGIVSTILFLYFDLWDRTRYNDSSRIVEVKSGKEEERQRPGYRLKVLSPNKSHWRKEVVENRALVGFATIMFCLSSMLLALKWFG